MANLTTAIDKAKAKLIRKAKKQGMFENFGQKEVRKLKDKFGFYNLAYGTREERAQALQIEQFDQWCMYFDLSQLN